MYLSAGITLVTVVLPLGLHIHPPHVAGQAVQHLLLIDEGHHSLGPDDLTPDHSEDLGNDGLQRDVCLSVHVQYYEGMVLFDSFFRLAVVTMISFHLVRQSVLYKLGWKDL